MKKVIFTLVLATIMYGCAYTENSSGFEESKLVTIGLLRDPVVSNEWFYSVSIFKIKSINGEEHNIVFPDYINIEPGLKIIELVCYGNYNTVKLNAKKSHRYLFYTKRGCDDIWVKDTTEKYDEKLEIQ